MQLLTKSEIPSPSSQKLFAQVEWLFDQRGSLEANKSTRKNYSGCKSHFIKHLQEELGEKATDGLSADQLSLLPNDITLGYGNIAEQIHASEIQVEIQKIKKEYADSGFDPDSVAVGVGANARKEKVEGLF
ncbi:MAG: hypothetical protein ACO3A2_09645 [Bdellovibrionia bacterium]